MDVKKVLILLFTSALLIGGVCAADGVNDFKIDKSYENAYNGTYYSIYLNEKQDSGIAIFKNVNDDVDDNVENDDAFDNVVHDEGKEYLYDSEDIQVEKNSDNIANFTDIDNAEHGLAELIKSGEDQYIVVFFAKDGSDVKDSDLSSLLNEFNKDNNVDAIAF